jgi:uncharacterized membrane protein
MVHNPFAPPEAPSTYARPTAPGRLDASDALRTAWEALVPNLGLAVGGTVVFVVSMLVATASVLGLPLVVPVLLWGYLRFSVRLLDGRAELGDLFSGFQVYGQALGSMLLLFLFFFALGLPSQILSIAGAITELWVLNLAGLALSLAIAVLITCRAYFALYFITEEGLGTGDAVKAALDATPDAKGQAFIFAVLLGVLTFAGLLALGVGVLVAIPLTSMMYAAGYRQLRPLSVSPRSGW